jgi:AcrR family transcriptional regulator
MPGKRAPVDQRRDEILDAAFRVAAQKGLERLTVRAVAAEAGLSPGLVFFHFETKDALLLAMLDGLTAWMLGGYDEDLSLPAQFVNQVRNDSNFGGQERQFLELFIEFLVFGARHPEMRKRLREALKQYRQIFNSPAQNLVQSHVQSLPNTTPESLSALATSLVIGNAVQTLLDPEWMVAEKPLSAIEDIWER